jgi:ubiquinol-cytochrome c reductase cytochrome c1 subunit
MKRLILSLAALAFLVPATVQAAGDVETPPEHHWSFNGIFGPYDRAQLLRGLEVYRSVCANCHGLQYVRFRDLQAIGLSEDEVKAIAANYTVAGEPDEFGDPTTREAKPFDAFPSPFPNDQAARASNGGALPPDLSLIAKSREHGPDYIHALIGLGYGDNPEPDDGGLYHNPYMAGGNIAMPPPLFDDAVEYHDGTAATVEQMSLDVSAFLMWAAEPKLEARKAIGMKVILFLLVLTGLFYVAKRKLWANVEH